ncbi:MAG: glycoside hydrolase family 16 protein [Chitinophagaceae bacterium]|nr:glycoside hydrolase family 16 protein [Chitinophagaceae bacterium]
MHALLVAAALFSMTTFGKPCNSESDSKQIPVKGYKLYWSDEFDGTKLNSAKWKYRALGARGDAFNEKSAISIDGKGHLVIEARKSDGKIIAGIVDTEGLFETTFGYFECRVKIPKLTGAWPSFWLQSSRNQDYGEPATSGVEIDVFEYFHHERKDSVSHTLHWGGYGKTHKVAGPVFGAMRKTADDFHTFALEWTPDSYVTYVDGVKSYETRTNISKVPEFLVLSLEVNAIVAGPLDEARLPARYVIDYVRVYKKAG